MKKSIIYYLVTAAMLISLASCSDKADESDSKAAKHETKPSVTSEAETASEPEPENKGEFNEKVFEEMCQNIVIRGQKVSFPFSLNDLGDEYHFDDDPLVVESKNMAYYDLFKGDEELCSVVVKSDDSNLRDNKTMSMWVSKPQYDIVINDIAIGDNISKVFEKYGKKEETPTEAKIYSRYDYKITDKKYIYFVVTSDGTIDEIELWWR